MSNVRTCRVSFTDTEGITHLVRVSAASLFEAAGMALVEFRRARFTIAEPGPATELTVAVETEPSMHRVPMGKLTAWLERGGRSPAEQAVRVRLKQLLGSIK